MTAAMRPAAVVLLSLFVTIAAASALTTGDFVKMDADSVQAARVSPRDADVDGPLDSFETASQTLISGWDHCETISVTVSTSVKIGWGARCYYASRNPRFVIWYRLNSHGALRYTVKYGEQSCSPPPLTSLESQSYSDGANPMSMVEVEPFHAYYTPIIELMCPTYDPCVFTGEYCFAVVDAEPANEGRPINPMAIVAPVIGSLMVLFVITFCCCRSIKERRLRSANAALVGAAISLDKSIQDYPQQTYPMQGFPSQESSTDKAPSAVAFPSQPFQAVATPAQPPYPAANTTQPPYPSPTNAAQPPYPTPDNAAQPPYPMPNNAAQVPYPTPVNAAPEPSSLYSPPQVDYTSTYSPPPPVDYSSAYSGGGDISGGGDTPMLTLWQYKKSEPAADAPASEPTA